MYEPQPGNPEPARLLPAGRNLILAVSLLALVSAAAAGALILSLQHRRQLREVAAGQQRTVAALEGVRAQLQAMAARLQAPQVQPSAPSAGRSARPSPAPRMPAASRSQPARVAADDPRWKNLESRLSEQQRALADTRQAVDKTRQELETSLASTRDELSTRIARTHEEVEALRKLGERNYYEFTVPKSKNLQRVGPLSLALRKTNVKRQTYEVELIVDDYKLKKKDVNLYEPVLIHLADRPQPLELVVNRIGKNEAQGYVSEPKFKTSELAARTPLAPAASSPPSR